MIHHHTPEEGIEERTQIFGSERTGTLEGGIDEDKAATLGRDLHQTIDEGRGALGAENIFVFSRGGWWNISFEDGHGDSRRCDNRHWRRWKGCVDPCFVIVGDDCFGEDIHSEVIHYIRHCRRGISRTNGYPLHVELRWHWPIY